MHKKSFQYACSPCTKIISRQALFHYRKVAGILCNYCLNSLLLQKASCTKKDACFFKIFVLLGMCFDVSALGKPAKYFFVVFRLCPKSLLSLETRSICRASSECSMSTDLFEVHEFDVSLY